MPRQREASSIEERFAKMVSDRLDADAPALAERLGPAPGSDRYGPRDVDALWDTEDETLDANKLFEALQQGITPEGAKAVALFRMAPDLLQDVVGTPQQPERAALIAKLAQHPGQYVLTVGHSHEAEKQVQYVEEQQKRAAKRQAGQMSEQPAPSGYAGTPMGDQGGY